MVITSFARWLSCVALCGAVILAGCGGAPLRPELLPDAADRLVARDFAKIIAQVEELPPKTTVFRVPRPIGPISSFDGALREEFKAIGYDIQSMSHTLTPSDPVLSHTVARSDSEEGKVLTYTVAVNEIEFRRGYAIGADGQVLPTTTMLVKGMDSTGLRQDDSIFESINELASVDSDSGSSGSVVEQAIVIDPIGEELIVIPPVVDLSASRVDEVDLRDTQIIDQSLLAFDGDSYLLGASNKRQVRNLINRFDRRRDVFSILGCVPASGISWTEGTTELVIGRTERVRSELLYAGISADKIIAEKCSDNAGSNQPPIPQGAILLLLNRGNSL